MIRLKNMSFHAYEPQVSDAAPILESRFKIAAADLFARAIGIMIHIDGIPYGRWSKRQRISIMASRSAVAMARHPR